MRAGGVEGRLSRGQDACTCERKERGEKERRQGERVDEVGRREAARIIHHNNHGRIKTR